MYILCSGSQMRKSRCLLNPAPALVVFIVGESVKNYGASEQEEKEGKKKGKGSALKE